MRSQSLISTLLATASGSVLCYAEAHRASPALGTALRPHWAFRAAVRASARLCRQKQKDRLLELEDEVEKLAQLSNGARSERAALLERNMKLKVRSTRCKPHGHNRLDAAVQKGGGHGVGWGGGGGG